MRPAWRELERRRADQVWKRSRDRFLAGVVGPHFEEVCRTWAADFAGAEAFGGVPAEIGHAVVNDSAHRASHEIDVVVLAEPDGGPRKVLSLGEVKWGDIMCEGHVERLRRVRDLLAGRGYDMRSTRLTCYSAAGFAPDLLAAKSDDIMLVSPDLLYS
jgi:hypothetical protein